MIIDGDADLVTARASGAAFLTIAGGPMSRLIEASQLYDVQVQ